jgi:hypothetical protein
MPVYWTYGRAVAVDKFELAHRKAISTLAQVGHFHDQVQIAAVFDGWRSFTTPRGTICASAGQIAVLPARLFHAPLMRMRSLVTIRGGLEFSVYCGPRAVRT